MDIKKNLFPTNFYKKTKDPTRSRGAGPAALLSRKTGEGPPWPPQPTPWCCRRYFSCCSAAAGCCWFRCFHHHQMCRQQFLCLLPISAEALSSTWNGGGSLQLLACRHRRWCRWWLLHGQLLLKPAAAARWRDFGRLLLLRWSAIVAVAAPSPPIASSP
jgi:hypothetical protein